jgi:hypothetical protein
MLLALSLLSVEIELRMELLDDRDTFLLWEDVWVRFVVVNRGTEPVPINDTGRVFGDWEPLGSDAYFSFGGPMVYMSRDGIPVDRGANWIDGIPGKPYYIQPGDSDVSYFSLMAFICSEPGEYVIDSIAYAYARTTGRGSFPKVVTPLGLRIYRKDDPLKEQARMLLGYDVLPWFAYTKMGLRGEEGLREAYRIFSAKDTTWKHAIWNERWHAQYDFLNQRLDHPYAKGIFHCFFEVLKSWMASGRKPDISNQEICDLIVRFAREYPIYAGVYGVFSWLVVENPELYLKLRTELEPKSPYLAEIIDKTLPTYRQYKESRKKGK